MQIETKTLRGGAPDQFTALSYAQSQLYDWWYEVQRQSQQATDGNIYPVLLTTTTTIAPSGSGGLMYEIHATWALTGYEEPVAFAGDVAAAAAAAALEESPQAASASVPDSAVALVELRDLLAGIFATGESDGDSFSFDQDDATELAGRFAQLWPVEAARLGMTTQAEG